MAIQLPIAILFVSSDGKNGSKLLDDQEWQKMKELINKKAREREREDRVSFTSCIQEQFINIQRQPFPWAFFAERFVINPIRLNAFILFTKTFWQ